MNIGRLLKGENMEAVHGVGELFKNEHKEEGNTTWLDFLLLDILNCVYLLKLHLVYKTSSFAYKFVIKTL